MVKVRDRTLLKSEYKGRETDASDELCPCRPCYCPHNCQSKAEWYWSRPLMLCVSRENGGCPSPKPAPEHIFTPRGRLCKRCGVLKPAKAIRL